MRVAGRALRAGERVRWTYGAGPAGARADMYAERGARLWVSVDGDGDGIREVVAESPTVDVTPGPAARVVAHVTSVVEPRTEAQLTVAVLDAMGNAWVDFAGDVTLEVRGSRLPDLPATLTLGPEDSACGAVRFDAPGAEGVSRVLVRARIDGRDVEALSNPLLVSATRPAVLWGDFHGALAPL